MKHNAHGPRTPKHGVAIAMDGLAFQHNARTHSGPPSTKMKPWGAAMSDDQDKDDGVEAAALSVDDPTRGYPMVPVAPRSALPIARAIDGHQRRRIGGRHFEFEFDLT